MPQTKPVGDTVKIHFDASYADAPPILSADGLTLTKLGDGVQVDIHQSNYQEVVDVMNATKGSQVGHVLSRVVGSFRFSAASFAQLKEDFDAVFRSIEEGNGK